MKVSELYGKEIYTHDAIYIGTVGDVILDLENGGVMQISLVPLKTPQGVEMDAQGIKEILKNQTIPYTEVTEVKDVVMCKRVPKAVLSK